MTTTVPNEDVLTPSPYVVETKGLSKRFGEILAVDSVDLRRSRDARRLGRRRARSRRLADADPGRVASSPTAKAG